MPRPGPEASDVKQLVAFLERSSRRYRAPIWMRIAALLKRPRRSQRALNIYKIVKHSKQNCIVATPSKVCAIGEISHPITLACPRISAAAREKITRAGGEVISYEELIQRNPRGSNVLLIV